MLSTLPLFVTIFFITTVLIVLAILFSAINFSYRKRSKKTPALVFLVILGWLCMEALLSDKGFYTKTNGFPPPFFLAVLPPFLLVVILFFTSPGKKLVDCFPLSTLTYIHTIRVLVEVVLYWLFLGKLIPGIMTFGGKNYDILAGITAPAIAYLYFKLKIVSKEGMILWNIVCIGLLANIVILGFLSAPFVFQQFGFGQPNIAVLYFPFIWLPSFIVPTLLFCHLASIRLLTRK